MVIMAMIERKSPEHRFVEWMTVYFTFMSTASYCRVPNHSSNLNLDRIKGHFLVNIYRIKWNNKWHSKGWKVSMKVFCPCCRVLGVCVWRIYKNKRGTEFALPLCYRYNQTMIKSQMKCSTVSHTHPVKNVFKTQSLRMCSM